MPVYSVLAESVCPELPFLFHAKTNLARNRKKIISKYRDLLITESRFLYMIILQLIILQELLFGLEFGKNGEA